MSSPFSPPERAVPQVLLTAAGFDPSSGAGITADLAVFAAHGAFGVSCITGLTVQSTTGVAGVEPVSAATVTATLECLAEDLPLAGIKIGMLATAKNVLVLDAFCAQNRAIPAVLDPVLRSSSGRTLLDEPGIVALREKLLGNVAWITPNLDELGLLTGTTVESAKDVPAAAKKLRALAAALGNPGLHVVVTGGHLDQDGESSDDFLFCDEAELWIPGERVETTSTHGTGCAFSSCLLAGLALYPGSSAEEQVREAKTYVRIALETAVPMGKGHGPMNLLWPLKLT